MTDTGERKRLFATARALYERLGFREVCAVNVYEWSPFTPPTPERP